MFDGKLQGRLATDFFRFSQRGAIEDSSTSKKGEKARRPRFDAPLPFDDGDTSRSRKCTRRGHSAPESRIPRELLIHRDLLNGAVRGGWFGGKERAERTRTGRGHECRDADKGEKGPNRQRRSGEITKVEIEIVRNN